MRSVVIATGVPGLLDYVARILRRQELTLLYIHGPARARRCHDEVSLPRKKSRNLKHICHCGHSFDLRNVVDIGKHRDIQISFDAP